MKLINRLSRSTCAKVLLAKIRLSWCWTALSEILAGVRADGRDPIPPILPRQSYLDCVVPALPIFAGFVLTRALVFHSLVVKRVADFFLNRALDALAGRRSLFGDIRRMPRSV